ncbi:hypothetical protein GIB67_014237 [Kingdonia uniflora]|uniref:Uncharacterized protein n=1 Tax=Kingdonia uniflora TaxID=39325 RepID=A0A7J7M1W5_9MAGN|nr:hypothetical protein GIB67_014237 [Kingdonia uniflora]
MLNNKPPFLVEAYHGLVLSMATTQLESESGELDLDEVVERIKNAMERCEKESVLDFKLSVAQVRVIEGKFMDALKVYEELVKEEPRDFRPYLCQGIVYMLLKKEDEAEEQFEMYREFFDETVLLRLFDETVPREHPYVRYFDESTFETKVLLQMETKDGLSSSGGLDVVSAVTFGKVNLISFFLMRS